MDGPDLSHLLDGASSEKPSPEVLDGIVRRHRRLKARRARTVASLGLVIALAGLGVGIGVSRGGPTTATALGGKASNAALVPGKARSTTTSSVLPSMSAHLPRPTSTPNSRLGRAPVGLGWVAAGSGSGSVNASTVPSSANSEVPSLGSKSGAAVCSVLSCPPSGSFGSLEVAGIKALFTRTSNGVTVRTFTATWAVAPFDLVPVASSEGASGSGSGGGAVGSAAGSGTTGTSAGTTSGAVVPKSTTTSTTTPAASSPLPVITATTDTTTTTSTGSTSTVLTPPGIEASCAATRALVVEVSDAGAVGVVTVPLGQSVARPFDVLADEVVGVEEQAPMAVVVAHTDGQVASVRADFVAGGQDEMTVVGQWAVLVDELAATPGGGTASQGTATSPGQASVYALSNDGTVLEQANLPGSGALAIPIAACMEPTGGVASPAGSGTGTSPAQHSGR
ncbi:MAG: hypothetical protein ACLQRM_07920 [Acidimicrobiales bacterium]